MSRTPVALALAASLFVVSCADSAPDFCAATEGGLPSFDRADSIDRWAGIEASLDGSLQLDAQALRVVAEQVVRMGDGASIDEVAAIVVRPGVVARVQRIEAARAASCS